MITAEQIKEILSLYKKHGWNISRVLLSDEIKNLLNDKLVELFDDSEIIETEINAVWFSRPSNHGKTAWELRHLSVNPFAVIEFFDEGIDESLKNETLKNAETRLKKHASNKRDEKKV